MRIESAQVAQILGAKAIHKIANNDDGAVTMPKIPSKFILTGLIAAGRSSVALIAFDGKPARAYRVGARVDEGLVLQSVDKRSARLGSTVKATATLTLELPSKPGPVVVSAFIPAPRAMVPAAPIVVPSNTVGMSTQPLTELGAGQTVATDQMLNLPKAIRMRGLPGAPPVAADGAVPADPVRN